MEARFGGLVVPVLGNRTGAMLDVLRCFGNGNALAAIQDVVGTLPRC